MKKGITFLSTFLILIFMSTLAFSGDIESFESSWEYRALKLQRGIDLNTPISHVTFLATHNSYNASAYSNLGCYWDPNQKYSLYDQLRMGIREFELDVHKYFSMKGWPWEWKTRLLLSHGQDNHTGVSAFDRELADGIAEFEDWIRDPENSEEVIMIDIEDHMDGEYDKALDIFEAHLGDLVYRPENPCQGIPRDLTKNMLLDSGRQIIIVSRGCKSSRWNSMIYAGTVDHNNGFPEEKPQHMTDYPDCGSAKFSRADYDKYMIRFYEDRTNLSNWFSDPGDQLEADDVERMVKCGVNIIGMDKIQPFDGRLKKAIWSWDQGEPNNWNNSEDCAVQKGNGRFNDIACGNSYNYACKNPETGDWYVTDGSGQWTDGNNICSDETGGQFEFSVPENGYENEKLKDEKALKGVANVWLNYSDRATEGEWETGNGSAAREEESSTESGAGGCASSAYAAGKNGTDRPFFPGFMSLLIMTFIPFSFIFTRRRFAVSRKK